MPCPTYTHEAFPSMSNKDTVSIWAFNIGTKGVIKVKVWLNHVQKMDQRHMQNTDE